MADVILGIFRRLNVMYGGFREMTVRRGLTVYMATVHGIGPLPLAYSKHRTADIQTEGACPGTHGGTPV
jgi:hypothetical protein